MKTSDRTDIATTRRRAALLGPALMIALLAGTLIANESGAQGDSRNVYHGGEALSIVHRGDRMAVRFAAGLTESDRMATIARHDLIARATPVEEIAFASVEIFALAAPLPPTEMLRVGRELSADPGIVSASPVYQYEGGDLIPTERLFLQLRPGVPEAFLEELLLRERLELVERTFWREGNFLLRPASDSPFDAIAASEQLLLYDEVAFSSPDFLARFETDGAPSDPLYPRQWNFDNLPQVGGWNEDADTDAPEGWEIQMGCANVRIAVLDNGVDMDHPDLQGNLDAANAYDFVSNDPVPDPDPGDTHGTRCSGLAAAIPDNGIGIVGVAGGALIIPIRIFSTGWGTYAAVANGIAHAYMNGADVLSCSWHTTSPSDQITAAIHDAVTLGRGGLGSVVVLAAGNDNLNQIYYPGLLSDVIAVGATTPCDARKIPSATVCDSISGWGSNYGTELDVAAPGVKLPTTDLGGGYHMTFSGTSAATPQVAGLAALLVCKYPHYEGTEIRARLEQTCDHVGGYAYDATTGKSEELGHGRINIYRALSGKPQVELGPLPNHPSVYLDASDAPAPYPSTEHKSAAYEWLGEEYSPETGDNDAKDPDGAANRPLKDAFDDGVTYFPPYLPGQTGQIEVTVSVEDSDGARYQSDSLFVNVWFDWQNDGDWNMTHDWVVRHFPVEPSTWGGVSEHTYTIPFVVPDDDIEWHIQSSAPSQFLNVRTRLTYDEKPTTADETMKWGEIEDDRFVNFVEMFDVGAGYMSRDPASCDGTWEWVEGQAPWQPGSCPPLFNLSDGPPENGYMTNNSDHPLYFGDGDDALRTPSFDFSEMTEAVLMFEQSGIEFIRGRVVAYVAGALDSVLMVYDYLPTTPPACGTVYSEIVDLTVYCGDGFDDVAIAFESFLDEACGTTFPDYQDWHLDNVVVFASDKIDPAPKVATVLPWSENTAFVDWIAPGDDGIERRAELYNIRYGPEAIDGGNWRHSMWVRGDMVASLPLPQPPGSNESIFVSRLSGGLHHFSVRTIDEVNNISSITDGGGNDPPDQTVPDTYVAVLGDTVSFPVTATDPDFDPLLLFTTQRPASATYVDNGNGQGTFRWIPSGVDIGRHEVIFVARDWNGSRDTDTTGVTVLPLVAPDYDDHDNNNATLSVTDQGILGFLDGSQADGSGFVYPAAGGTNHLFVGGLWIGESTSYVANRDFDLDPNREWAPTEASDVELDGPKQEIRSAYSDLGAAQPRGLSVDQISWSFSSPSSYEDFVIIRYLITNTGNADLSGLHVALMTDFDMNGEGGDDTAGTDASRRLAWIADTDGIYAGVRFLEPAQGGLSVSNLTLIHNPTYVYPEEYILDADKYAFLTAADAQHILTDGPTPDDYSLLVAAGPFDLAVGSQREVAFAVLGGGSIDDLKGNADMAQSAYEGQASDAPETVGLLPAPTQLLLASPNPFESMTTLRYDLGRSGPVELDVFDVGGRLVRSLLAENQPAGHYQVIWNGQDTRGNRAGSGIYYLRLRTAGIERTRSVLLMR